MNLIAHSIDFNGCRFFIGYRFVAAVLFAPRFRLRRGKTDALCPFTRAAVGIPGNLPLSSETLRQLDERSFVGFPTLTAFCISLILWSGRPGSNRRHSAWEADVLPLNYSRSSEWPSCEAQRWLPPNMQSFQSRAPDTKSSARAAKSSIAQSAPKWQCTGRCSRSVSEPAPGMAHSKVD